ncbi:MAG: nucleoside 2-deoxyribosyltransferase [bacterium]|nr:nucleoside 2-deoxyribosyltransferase [bacterium]
MKIYFAGSIRGGRDDTNIYKEIIEYLTGFGNVLTEHVGNSNLTSAGESMSVGKIFERDMAWLREADIVIAEVSTPSLGVGVEIAITTDVLSKPLLCLYRNDLIISAMILGNPNVKCRPYKTLDEAKDLIGSFIDDYQRNYRFSIEHLEDSEDT